ncbi:hypothetical protein [Azohydromonas caseinilytica]|uniref:Uncharacterized protein n=1 Tax=Azohydromonas caseinilytica TaxID=2728836 RepID=A0A848FFD9_9BURK|nr:hypothetical protein [Azohydromonas caseinilytica]NML17039.1 hypothetical protein [Azohydromonas caseinilytica]
MSTADEIFEEVRNSFLETNSRRRRRFLPGLLIAMMNLVRGVRGHDGRFSSMAEFYAAYPRQTVTADGGRANTLIISIPGENRTQSIRPYYEAFVRWLRIDNKRLDYPKAAPHATQAWGDYQHWLESFLPMTDESLDTLEQRVKAFVLEQLPAHVRDTSALRREPLRFSLFLQNFDLSTSRHRGEKSGAAYQGTVFGYIRADAAHLQIETARVRSAGKREGRIGDIDALNGQQLVISAEVKQYIIKEDEVPDFEDFATQVANEGALGLVVALDFTPTARTALKSMGLEPLSRSDMQSHVRLWDALKQRVAVEALLYYVTRIEQNAPLRDRVMAFFADIEAQTAAAAAGTAELPEPTADLEVISEPAAIEAPAVTAEPAEQPPRSEQG